MYNLLLGIIIFMFSVIKFSVWFLNVDYYLFIYI